VKTGTIMELKGRSAVLLTDDCDFVKIPRTDEMELGQRTTYKEKKKVLPFQRMSKRTLGALIAACIMIGVLGIYFSLTPVYEEPYAYLTVDINPSIELAIDREYKVIGWNTFNIDGESVIRKLQLKGESVDLALTGIMNEARTQGFFKDYEVGAVLLTAIPNEKYDDFNSHKKQVTEELTLLVGKEEKTIEKLEGSKVNITTETLSPEIRAKAKKKKISAGRQYLMNNAEKSGSKNITEEDIKKANITELLMDHGNQVLGEKAFEKYKTDDNAFLEKIRNNDKIRKHRKEQLKDGQSQLFDQNNLKNTANSSEEVKDILEKIKNTSKESIKEQDVILRKGGPVLRKDGPRHKKNEALLKKGKELLKQEDGNIKDAGNRGFVGATKKLKGIDKTTISDKKDEIKQKVKGRLNRHEGNENKGNKVKSKEKHKNNNYSKTRDESKKADTP